MCPTRPRSESPPAFVHPDERPIRRGPKTPFHQRIRWSPEERTLLVDAWIAIISDDQARQYKSADVLAEAQRRALPPERHRKLESMGTQDLAWFVGQVQARFGISDEDLHAPVEEAAPATPEGQRIVWTAEEKELLIAAGIEILRADGTGRMSNLEALKRAQLKALPPDRHRRLMTLPLSAQAWFIEGVERVLDGPDPVPEPEPAPEPIVAVPATIAPPLAPTPAPAPVPALAAPTPTALNFADLAPGLDSQALIALLLHRLISERAQDLAIITSLQGEIRDLQGKIQQFGDRLAPLDRGAAQSYELLRKVMESLDPTLVKAAEAEPGPQAIYLEPAADVMPKVRICILGIKRETESQVRARVNGQATISCIMDSTKAMHHDYRQYDNVVATRHASYSVTKRVLAQLGPDRVTKLDVTGTSSVVEAIADLSLQHEQKWQRQHRN